MVNNLSKSWFFCEKKNLTELLGKDIVFGQLCLQFQYLSDNLILLSSYNNPHLPKKFSSQKKKIIPLKDNGIELRPDLYSGFVVFRNKDKLYIPPSQIFSGYLMVPAKLSVYKSGTGLLFSGYSEYTSKTWIGANLGKGYATTVLKNCLGIESSERMPEHIIVLPVSIENKSDQDIPIDKFNVNFDYVTLYRDKKRLLATGIKIIYSDQDKSEEIEYLSFSRNLADSAVVIRKAKSVPEADFVKRTFELVGKIKGDND